MPSTPPTQAVANLHLHLEYDSGLDVIAAALAAVPNGPDADEERAHVSQDITSAVAHLLDMEALAPAGSPLRVTDVAMEVLVDIADHDHGHDDDEPEDPEEAFDALLGMAKEFAKVFDGLDLTEDESSLISQAPLVAGVVGPPPFEDAPEGMSSEQMVAEWGILSGYLAEACANVMDVAFDDLEHLARLARGGRPFEPGHTQIANRLPEEWVEGYDVLFFRQFILTLGEVTTRMTHEWEHPSNIAQLVALSVIFDEMVSGMEESMDSDDEDVRELSPHLIDSMRGRAVPDAVEDIFEEAPDYPLEMWFVPFSPDERVAPYAAGPLGL